jgi:nucleotide-binding universal stress UspA family protein
VHQYLEDVAASTRRHGLTVRVHVEEGRPGSVIRRAVREHEAHVVAMATHGRGGVSRLLMGSVTESVLHNARVPILVVRPPAVRIAQEAEQVQGSAHELVAAARAEK